MKLVKLSSWIRFDYQDRIWRPPWRHHRQFGGGPSWELERVAPTHAYLAVFFAGGLAKTSAGKIVGRSKDKHTVDSIVGTSLGVDKSSDRVREMFAQIAGKYDLMNHLLSLNVDKHWRRAAVERIPISGQDPILDVCTGTGDLAFAFRRKYPTVPIVGADFCQEMLEIARQKQHRQRLNAIDFVEASAMDMPFDDDRFQVVSVAFGIRNVEDTDQGLSEIIRVCKPGGTVAILEFSEPTLWPLSTIYNFYFRRVLPRVGQMIAKNDKSAYEYLPSSVGEFLSGQSFADRLMACGLKDITMFPMTLGVATLYMGVK